MNLSPLPKQKFFGNDGLPLVGGQLFTYAAGTSTKVDTYRDSAGTLNTNPIVLDYRGECDVWLDPTRVYKFTLAPPGDTDPPTRPIWTVDNIESGVSYSSLTRSFLGAILFPRTSAEIAAGVTPTNYYIPSHEAVGEIIPTRYGADNTGGTSTTSALNNSQLVSAQAFQATIKFLHGQYKFTTQPNAIGYGIMIEGPGSQGTTEPYGCVLLADYDTNDFLRFDGSGGAGARGTGGGLKNMTILAGTGRTPGRAIYLVAGGSNNRPGEMMIENVLVFGQTTGLWTKAIEIDGTLANTVGSKGVRTVHFEKVRVADCSTNNKYVHFNQAVHISGQIDIDTGNGTGTTGITIEGDWDNIFLSDCRLGNVVMDYTGVNNPAFGLSDVRVDTFDNNSTRVVGNASIANYGGACNNASKTLQFRSNVRDSFQVNRTSSVGNVTGDGTVYTVVYQNERYDKNAVIDPTVGVYTCKIAGEYTFNATICFNGLVAGHTTGSITIVRKNAGAVVQESKSIVFSPFAIANAAGQASNSLELVCEVNETDTVQVDVLVNGGAKVVGVTSGTTPFNTSFCGRPN